MSLIHSNPGQRMFLKSWCSSMIILMNLLNRLLESVPSLSFELVMSTILDSSLLLSPPSSTKISIHMSCSGTILMPVRILITTVVIIRQSLESSTCVYIHVAVLLLIALPSEHHKFNSWLTMSRLSEVSGRIISPSPIADVLRCNCFTQDV